MSDPFTPALPAGAAPPGLRPPVVDEKPADPPASADILHLTGIAEEIASAFRHMGDVIPALQPLLSAAARIEARIAAMREKQAPPASS